MKQRRLSIELVGPGFVAKHHLEAVRRLGGGGDYRHHQLELRFGRTQGARTKSWTSASQLSGAYDCAAVRRFAF